MFQIMDFYLSSITLHHFKSFGNTTNISFNHPFTCITGKNGCGKSSIIDALCCCLGCEKKNVRISNYKEVITHLDNQICDNCSVQLQFHNHENKPVAAITFSTDLSGNNLYLYNCIKSRFRYNGKIITRERLRSAVFQQLGLPIYPSPLFVIQQNHIQNFCNNDDSFLIHFIQEV